MKVIKFIKIYGRFEKNLAKINLFFIFIFLNLWDYLISREFFNGMILGLVMFGPAVFLWFVGTVRAAALVMIMLL